MKCSDLEKSIYLFEELSASEKRNLEMHLAECAACRALAAQVKKSRSIIQEASTLIPELKNPNQITQRIMQELRTEERVGVWSQLTVYIDSVFVRYAFSAMSLVLVLLFVWEWRSEVDLAVRNSKLDFPQGSILNARAISNQYLNQKKANHATEPVSRYAYYKQSARK